MIAHRTGLGENGRPQPEVAPCGGRSGVAIDCSVIRFGQKLLSYRLTDTREGANHVR